MEIKRSLHTALLVSDLTRSEQFYSVVLGLTKVDRELKFPGVWYQIEDVQLHLIVAPHLPSALVNPEKWGRNPHIAFAVSNLEAAKERLVSHGCPIQSSASGRAVLFTQDPDRNVIELSEA